MGADVREVDCASGACALAVRSHVGTGPARNHPRSTSELVGLDEIIGTGVGDGHAPVLAGEGVHGVDGSVRGFDAWCQDVAAQWIPGAALVGGLNNGCVGVRTVVPVGTAALVLDNSAELPAPKDSRREPIPVRFGIEPGLEGNRARNCVMWLWLPLANVDP